MIGRKITEEMYWKTQRSLSGEFSKYVLDHPEFDERIPDGAEIIFQIKDNPDFNQWARKIAKTLHEDKRPMMIVEIEKLAPPAPTPSRLLNPRIETLK